MMLGHLSIQHLLLISNNDNIILKAMLYMSTMAMPNTKSYMQFYNHVCLKIVHALVQACSRRVSICIYIFIAHRKMSKSTTGAVEARTNQYIAPRSTNTAPRSTRTAPANRQPNKQNIELEPYEQIYDEMD